VKADTRQLVRALTAAVVVFVLQVTVVRKISIAGASPDLVLVLLILLVAERGPVAAVVIGFSLGFLQDLGNASFLGMNALAKSIVAYGVSRVGAGFLPDSLVFKVLLIVVASLVNDLVVLIVTTQFDVVEILVAFFRYSLLSALYAGLIGSVALGVARIAGGMTGRRRGAI
jgi:rod shape-determining protein MreD